jgi:hypothetical protein
MLRLHRTCLCVPETWTDGLTVLCGGLSVGVCVLRNHMPIVLYRSSERDFIGRSSHKGCSRSIMPPIKSQAVARMNRE